MPVGFKKQQYRGENGKWEQIILNGNKSIQDSALGWKPCKLPVGEHDYLRLHRIPAVGRCADTDKKILSNNVREYLACMPYLELDRRDINDEKQDRRDVITIDVDSDVDATRFESANIPPPRYLCGRRGSTLERVRRPHIVWWLKYPIYTSNTQAIIFFDVVRNELIRLLRGIGCVVDEKSPLVSKNPHNDAHDVVPGTNEEWTLTELREWMSREPLRQAQPISDDRSSSHTSQEERTRETYARAQTNYFDESHALAGRNSKAFESVRGLVYAAKSQCNTECELREYALNELELFNALNNWHDPLPDKELRYLARSMASWTWRKYTAPGGHIDRGVCRREGLMPHVATNKTKQAVGGVYGAKKNAQNKLELIKEARLQMIDRGEEVTVSALARDVNMSRNTVRKHLRAIDDDAQHQAIAECKQLLETHNWVVKTVAIRKRYIENSFGNGHELHRSASQRAEQSLWDRIDAEENGSPAVSCVSGEEMMAEFEAMDSVTQGTLLKKWTLSDEEAV